ncbi:class I SAM-dependent methyltransferase [Pseudoalteromonas sp. MTN2-4]|uniref:class I SAM-dependent methyltransferase n=1 Tax=Pseudoalteromonas sp. MTN2-4 TaxID=3056555 RepID=UPI0036F36C6F
MAYSKESSWNEVYASNSQIAYPPEALIRILLGTFPELSFLDKNFKGKKVLDVGYGDGRNFPLFDRLGLLCHGVEITKDIVSNTLNQPAFSNLNLDLKVGSCDSLPYNNGEFDYLVTWNSSYYMKPKNYSYLHHITELMRVVKSGGYIIASVPMPSSFIYDSCKTLEDGYVEIRNDYFNVRNGQIMKQFENKEDFTGYFAQFCSEISCAEITMNWFGLSYDWYVMVGKKC